MAEPLFRESTRLKRDAWDFLDNATQEQRDAYTNEAEEGIVYVIHSDGGHAHNTDLPFSVVLSNRIFTGHRVHELKQQTWRRNSATIKIVQIVLHRLPPEIKDIRHVLLWLEDYARCGQPPDIHPNASRAYLSKFLFMAEQFGIEPLSQQLLERIKQLTDARGDAVRWNQRLRLLEDQAYSNPNPFDQYGRLRSAINTPRHGSVVDVHDARRTMYPNAYAHATGQQSHQLSQLQMVGLAPYHQNPQTMQHINATSTMLPGLAGLYQGMTTHDPQDNRQRRSSQQDLRSVHTQSIQPVYHSDRLDAHVHREQNHLPGIECGGPNLEGAGNGGQQASDMNTHHGMATLPPITLNSRRFDGTTAKLEDHDELHQSTSRASPDIKQRSSSAKNGQTDQLTLTLTAQLGGQTAIRSPHTPANTVVSAARASTEHHCGVAESNGHEPAVSQDTVVMNSSGNSNATEAMTQEAGPQIEPQVGTQQAESQDTEREEGSDTWPTGGGHINSTETAM